MPHDKNGAELKVGDKVTVEFTVEEVNAHPDHCNVKLRTVEPFHPNPDGNTSWFNTRQAVKVLGVVLLAVVGLLGSAGTASAFGKRCGNCTTGATNDRGGPLRNLIGGAVDRIHDRRTGHTAEAAPTGSTATVYHTQPGGGATCVNGVCYPARR